MIRTALLASFLLALAGVHARADQPAGIRLRLAVLMAQEGDHRGDEIVLAYVAKGQPRALRQLAVKSLPSDELGSELITLLAVGSHDDGWIALCFREHPRHDAVRALEVAPVRHREGEQSTIREWIEEALATCRRPR